MIELNLKPTNSQLRQFGFIAFFALPLIGWFLTGRPTPATWTPLHSQRIGIFALIGVVSGIAAWLRPSLLRWMFVAVSVVTFPVGFVLGEIIMMAIFAVAFIPLAFVFRLIGRDALQRKIDPNAATYWQARDTTKSAKSYYRQS